MEEKNVRPVSGYLVLLIWFALMGLAIYLGFQAQYLWLVVTGIVVAIMAGGFFFINPNGSRVMTLFGEYKGTVKDNGFFWVNPFFSRKDVSLRAKNFEGERLKVNDKRGNPIYISVIIVWRVRNAYKAAFEVENYENFVKIQSDSAVRHMAGSYSYDNFDDEQKEITLRSGMDEVNHSLEKELSERLALAGIEVMEARIGYLAYAEEIAGAMLK
ncbi:MAG: SPFH domain-containing protein, partial [Bacteroidota bacterium]